MKLTATAVPHSSTVGSSIKVCDETGQVVAILAIMVPNPQLDYKTTAQEISNEMLWKLGKRPVAFRVLNDLDEWDYYDDERRALAASERLGTEYQGLYVRDGS